MCSCSVTCNEWSTAVAVDVGSSWSQSLSVSAGYTCFAVWCERPCSISFRFCQGDNEDTFDEHWGQIATLQCLLIDGAEVEITVGSCRTALLADDAKAVQKSLKSLKENGLQYELERQAASLFRTAAITVRVATFLANLDEFCVIKRRLWMKGKQLLSPPAPIKQVVECISCKLDVGSRTWRRSSGSFSTMMRFIQRSKENFKWQSEICILT